MVLKKDRSPQHNNGSSSGKSGMSGSNLDGNGIGGNNSSNSNGSGSSNTIQSTTNTTSSSSSSGSSSSSNNNSNSITNGNNSNNNTANSMPHEQPVTKRKKIEGGSSSTVSSVAMSVGESTQMDIIIPSSIVGPQSPSSTSSSSSSSSSTSSSASSSLLVGIDQVDHDSGRLQMDIRTTVEYPSDILLKQTVAITNSATAAAVAAANTAANTATNNSTTTLTVDNEMILFQTRLLKQCLCGVTERTLRRPFANHYSQDVRGVRRAVALKEWPVPKLLQLLSNVQLLFDIYLKQNCKGTICGRIMDVCDALIRNEHNFIDEIIELCDNDNKYVAFLSGRLLASFLVIAKDNMENNWLKKIVENLFMFEHLDFIAVRKINFSIEIIKRIVEWNDIEEHPLHDDVATLTASGVPSLTDFDITPLAPPPLEQNYFAMQLNNGSGNTNLNAGPSSSCSTASSSSSSGLSSASSSSVSSSSSNRSVVTCHGYGNIQLPLPLPLVAPAECQVVTLTDSESFDTTHLKCVTIKILENKWPALVKNISQLILSHRDISYAENCIVTFLGLWESIISVKANLSIVETLPFYAQLHKFESLLNQSLPAVVYKQMLTLFNEALCYGSTLALQDLLPEETCSLAHQIVRHVKDYRILDSLPRHQIENPVSLIGFGSKSIAYTINGFERDVHAAINTDNNGTIETPDIDKTVLQKMVLLVLKSIAITVKEIRCDSSDSSIDSTDYDAFQDMVLIERSIRDVLKKLETFIKSTLEFHPESHFSKILIHLFDDQDDYLIEAMVCTLDVTAGISFRNNAFPELVSMLNPVFTFLEFLRMISNSSDLLLDLLVSNETCFLLYLLRFLKYIRLNWSMFVASCAESSIGNNILDEAMSVLIRLRLQISRLVSKSLYPYDIAPILRLLESCESLYEGNELS